MKFPGSQELELVWQFNLTQHHVALNTSKPRFEPGMNGKWWKVPIAHWNSKFCQTWDPTCETWLVHELYDISAWPTVDVVVSCERSETAVRGSG